MNWTDRIHRIAKLNDAEIALREELASIEHERWADWQSYVHGKCKKNDDGSLTIPAAEVERWERQIKTDYADLSDEEKESDREQVDRYWYLIHPDKEVTDKLNEEE